MTKETLKFAAETDKIFKLMVHSLYENKDIVLRELISNASDACDKLRYEAVQRPELLKDDELRITVELDKENRLLKISDNGVGMDKQSLIENLGTIARSGTQKFMESLTGDKKNDNQLIGQFGVGFYSSFMIADNVTVISQAAGEDKAYIWNSNGNGEFSIDDAPSNIGRGTIVTLHIKEDEDDFLDRFRVKSIIENYSNHIAFKIVYKEENDSETILNDGKAIWLKSKSEIEKEDYNEFYKTISHLGDDEPYLTIHNRAEGLLEYNSLLYVPSRKPFDLFHPDRLTRIKLYIKRVLISENLEVIPAYLRFLRGVVDSNDLPLNISRETIQNSSTLQKIKTSITKKVLKELSNKMNSDKNDYLEFWDNFGAVLKEGLCDGLEPRDEILEACLFQTNMGEDYINLKEYKERMKPEQKSIYFINASNRAGALASPQIEGFVKQGFEVIILTDSVDDFWVNVLHEYKGTQFKSVTKAGSDLDDIQSKSEDKAEENKNTENVDGLISFVKGVLGNQVKDVRKTSRLAESPVCLTVPEGAMDIRLERFMIDNKQLAQASAKIFEINSNHPIIKKLTEDIANESNKDKAKDIILLLFAQANIIEGEPVPDIKHFTSNFNRLIELNLAA